MGVGQGGVGVGVVRGSRWEGRLGERQLRKAAVWRQNKAAQANWLAG